MKGKKLKRGLALVLGLMLAAEVPASVAAPFKMFDSYAYTGAATVKATSLNVRSGAGTGYSSVGRLAAGAAVTVIGEQRGTDGNTWYQIQYTGTGGAVNTGYVSSVYIRLPVVSALLRSMVFREKPRFFAVRSGSSVRTMDRLSCENCL